MTCRVLLLGGGADGFVVTLQQLSVEIYIQLQEGRPVARVEHEAFVEDPSLESYRLVEPVGPDMPVYVRG